MDNQSRRTPSEVAADASIEHSGKGVLNTVKGTVRQAWGRITCNRRHQFGGKVDELKGRAQLGLGKMEAKEADLLQSRGRSDPGKDDKIE